ncbi:hypothetical protein NJB1604_06190 [Mycobacterium marinum]|nr:hypothetical protein NJB1604_06190 [Mycobacterium marinum]
MVAAIASLNVALPDISRQIHAHRTQQCRIVDAYSQLFASLLLTCGALGDRFGRRMALVAGLIISGTGSDPLAPEEQRFAGISGDVPYRHTADPARYQERWLCACDGARHRKASG